MNTIAPVSVMDQFAAASTKEGKDMLCSGLAHVGLPTVEGSGKVVDSSLDAVMLLALPVTGLLLLRATTNARALSDALEATCGIALSTRLRSNTKESYCVRWMSPDCWLLSCPLDEAFDIENALRETVSGHIAIVNVSGGYSMIELSGRHAREVLMKSTGYDTHPDHFPVGKVVNTTFAKTQLTLRCVELGEQQECYELIIRRSFCDYVWLWIQRASAEYGLVATLA